MGSDGSPKTCPRFCDELLQRRARPVGDVKAQLRGGLLEQPDVALADGHMVGLERLCQIEAVVAHERAHAVGVARMADAKALENHVGVLVRRHQRIFLTKELQQIGTSGKPHRRRRHKSKELDAFGARDGVDDAIDDVRVGQHVAYDEDKIHRLELDVSEGMCHGAEGPFDAVVEDGVTGAESSCRLFQGLGAGGRAVEHHQQAFACPKSEPLQDAEGSPYSDFTSSFTGMNGLGSSLTSERNICNYVK